MRLLLVRQTKGSTMSMATAPGSGSRLRRGRPPVASESSCSISVPFGGLACSNSTAPRASPSTRTRARCGTGCHRRDGRGLALAARPALARSAASAAPCPGPPSATRHPATNAAWSIVTPAVSSNHRCNHRAPARRPRSWSWSAIIAVSSSASARLTPRSSRTTDKAVRRSPRSSARWKIADGWPSDVTCLNVLSGAGAPSLAG